MFLVRASHKNALHSTYGEYLHTALITLSCSPSTSKSDKNSRFAKKTVSFFEAILKIYCTTFFFVFVFICFFMENDTPPHLNAKERLFYSFEIIQTTPKMNLIFDISKFLVSSGIGLFYYVRMILLGIIFSWKYTK